MLRIVYWFYYRWSPPYNHIYTYTCDFKFCFISRHVSEIIEHDLNWHTFTYLLHKVCVCVWCVMLGNIFFRKILFRHQFIWICAKEISGENFFSSYVYTYISNISVIYQDKISKVDYLHTLSFYSENFFKWICLYNDLPH